MKYDFYYTGIRVRSLERSLRFYTNVLGMQVGSRGKMDHGGEYVHLPTPGSYQRLELNWYPAGSRFYTKYQNGEELDHSAFVVDDVEKTFKELVRQGARVAVKPSEARGTEVYVRDLDGIWIELLS